MLARIAVQSLIVKMRPIVGDVGIRLTRRRARSIDKIQDLLELTRQAYLKIKTCKHSSMEL